MINQVVRGAAKFLGTIFKPLTYISTANDIEKYLSGATDHADLERRIKNINWNGQPMSHQRYMRL